jgi:hypothetical protein
MGQRKRSLPQIVYVFLYALLWVILAVMPVVGLLGLFNPRHY